MEPFIGQIIMVGFNFAPRGWAKCQGQLLAIASHQALFSLLGTMYGGDGRTTFGLPDYRGRTPIGEGSGPGLSNVVQGQRIGQETTAFPTGQVANGTGDTVSVLTKSSNTGAVNNMQPSLGTNFIIALNGRFPDRS